MIDLFPSFSRLELKHKTAIQGIVNRLLPYSDFNFISLYSWNIDDSTHVSMLNGNLVIRQPDYVTSKPILMLLGNNKIDESLVAMLQTTHELKLVPELTVKSINNHQLFTIIEDRDNHDYVYDLGEIVELSGKKFKKIRNKLNKFNYVSLENGEVRSSENADKTEVKDFVKLFDEWARSAQQSTEDSATERLAFIKLLDASDSLPLLFITVRKDSHLIAIQINEVIENKYAVCHFEKALPIYENLAIFVTYEGAKALHTRGVKYANWEQDLGIPGLRQAKLKWHPVKFLKKYTIRLRD